MMNLGVSKATRSKYWRYISPEWESGPIPCEGIQGDAQVGNEGKDQHRYQKDNDQDLSSR